MRVLIDERGPCHHGVVRHAQTLVQLLGAEGHIVVPAGEADVVHAQFTDSIWGPDIAAATSSYLQWAAGAGRPLVVTLHDVPGTDRDPERDTRRIAGYARVVEASDAIIVSSWHEAAKVRAFSPGRRVEMIDLPLPHPPAPAPGRPEWAGASTLGVLGFIYPGKGHHEVIASASRQRPRPTVLAVGAVSPGHEHLHWELATRAATLGVEMVVTGAVSDAEMASYVDAVTVPVAPSPSASASASLLTWLAGLRRPLAFGGDYVREIDGRRPGLIARFDDPSGLDDLVARALAEPGWTRLDHRPQWPDVGEAHARLYAQVRTQHSCGRD